MRADVVGAHRLEHHVSARQFHDGKFVHAAILAHG
jgi:hypothetical protein